MGCFYCEKSQALTDQMVLVCELEESVVYLVKDQSFPGRCVVTCKEHVTELFSLPAPRRHVYTDEVALVSRAIYELFDADKMNYAIYGDGVPHLHVHLVPKKKDGYCWGGPFRMDGEKVLLGEKEQADRIALIAEKISSLKNV